MLRIYAEDWLTTPGRDDERKTGAQALYQHALRASRSS
jgi:hypothetical protein